MEIEFAFLADSAQAPGDGKIYVLGGGITVLRAPFFPHMHHTLTLVVSLSVHPLEVDRPHELSILLWDADGKQIGPGVTGQFGAQRNPEHPNWTLNVPVALTYANTVFPAPGEYEFHIAVDGRHLKTLNLYLLPLPLVGTTPAA